MLDLLFTEVSYPDFESGTMKVGNIGIKDGTIEYIGTGTPESKEVLELPGKVLAPGFIDIHMHEENFVTEGEKYIIAEMMLRQGVTLAVGGNCGIQRQDVAIFRDTIGKLGGAPINYMMLAGYNQHRYKLGLERFSEATKAEQEKIAAYLRAEFEAGAAGMSFGIEYDPGITFDEVIQAVSAVPAEDMLVAAHYRSDSTESIPAIEEMIEIQKNIAQRFQISHLSSCCAMGQMDEGLPLIHEAMKADPRLNYDTYPYNAFSTFIGSEVFDDTCLETWGKTYSDILLTEDPYLNVYCDKAIFEDARENHPDILAVAFAMNEEEITATVADPLGGMIASDSIITLGNGHPRCAGTFPRVLGKYVREEHALSLYDALRKMSYEQSLRLNLKTKGQIAIGFDADLTIFDPDTIADEATYTNAALPPKGIEYVFVGGTLACKGTTIVNDRAGHFIPYK